MILNNVWKDEFLINEIMVIISERNGMDNGMEWSEEEEGRMKWNEMMDEFWKGN